MADILYAFAKHASGGDPSDGSPFVNHGRASNTKPLALTHCAIALIVIFVALVTIALGTTVYLLCTCCRSRKRRRDARKPLDDRMSFSAWNPKGPRLDKQEAGTMGMVDSEDVELRPLSKAAVRPAGRSLKSDGFDFEEVHPGRPVVVDEAQTAPAYISQRATRYYSQMGARNSMWKRLSSRVSQIGKAY